jgi:signal transduction histidine kinase
LRVLQRANGVCFEVRDRGTGVAEADIPRLFPAFSRAERSRSRSTGGVGPVGAAGSSMHDGSALRADLAAAVGR